MATVEKLVGTIAGPYAGGPSPGGSPKPFDVNSAVVIFENATRMADALTRGELKKADVGPAIRMIEIAAALALQTRKP